MRQADSGKIAALLLVVVSMIMLSSLAFAQERPEFVYPIDNQSIAFHPPWKFKVQPMANAQKFSWSIYQKGRRLSEQTTGNEFEILPGDVTYKQFIRDNPIEVRVQAFVAGKWTKPTIITVMTQDPQPVKSAQPTAVGQQPASASRKSPSDPASAQERSEFIHPTNGQTFNHNDTFKFKVKPIAKAGEYPYSWNIMQNGAIVAVERTTDNEFSLAPGAKGYSKFVPGRIQVHSRVLVNGEWTEPTTATFSMREPPPGLPTQWFLLLFVLPFPLAYLLVKHFRWATAEHAKWVDEAYKRALANAHLPNSLTQPAQQLCLKILSNEGAFQNRRLSPQTIEVVLRGWLYCLLHNKDKQIQLSTLLTDPKRGEATFSVPLYSLHADVSGAIGGVLITIAHNLSWADGTPFKRLVKTLYDNWAAVNGFNPDRGEQPPKKTLGVDDLKHKLLPDELIERFLARTPFVDFFRTPLPVAIPHRSRFAHTHIVGGTEHGKSQLLQYIILHDLPHVAAGNRSVVVIDSQGDLINNILSLAAVGALAERVVIIDPEERTAPPALNLFDFGLDRMNRYSGTERENLVNSAIDLCEYVFGAVMGAELTAKQGVIFGYLAHLLMVVPEATIDNLIDFLEKPELVREHLAKLDDPMTKRFFDNQFFNKSFDHTREEILYRIYDVLNTRALARMFRNKRNKLDMFSAMNRGSLILIDTAKGSLGQEGCEIFGRFFIALICQAAQEREPIAQHNRRDTFVYIDEAHDYFDESIEHLLEQARKFRVGLVLAHQHLGQLKELRQTVMTNTAIKLVGGISANDAQELAKNMGSNCTPKFLLEMRKHEDEKEPYTDFACYIKNTKGLESAIPFGVPLGAYDDQPKMATSQLASLKAENRRRYGGATDEQPPDKPKGDDSPLGDPELL